MAQRIPTRLTAAEGRRFAFPVGIAFLVLAGVGWWRDHLIVPVIFATLGGVLLTAGLVAPTMLGPVQRAWMAFAVVLSKVTTPVFMTIIYYLVITPMGLAVRAFGYRPLRRPLTAATYWQTREGALRRSDLKRQF